MNDFTAAVSCSRRLVFLMRWSTNRDSTPGAAALSSLRQKTSEFEEEVTITNTLRRNASGRSFAAFLMILTNRRSFVKATDLLRNDHESVKRMFAEFEKMGDKPQQKRSSLAHEICEMLRVHAAIEEAVFYPAVREVRDKQAKFDVEEALQEHKQMKTAMADVMKVDGTEPSFAAKMKVLKEDVEHHAEEEEEEIFKDARKLGDERLEELGVELQAQKNKLESSAQRHEETPTHEKTSREKSAR
jgi:hemerythrin superfamily protein